MNGQVAQRLQFGHAEAGPLGEYLTIVLACQEDVSQLADRLLQFVCPHDPSSGAGALSSTHRS